MAHQRFLRVEATMSSDIDRPELAARLAATTDQTALLSRYAALADVELAWTLKDLFYDTRISQPPLAAGAAAALATLADATQDAEVAALAAWITGIAVLEIDGQAEQAIAKLDQAAQRFEAIGRPHIAATTQVSKLHALAVLGRYDEAIACGLVAREVLLAHGDTLAAGKIEQNLGNIYWRQDRYAEAEQFLRAARERFIELGDQKQLAQVDNSLAFTLSLQYKFLAAAQHYQQALQRAQAAGLEVTQAEIECNLGNLALFQGRYDHALDYLERSRRRYAALGMPHESAIAELELADAYLELNLAPEAATIYSRVSPIFAELGMRAEQARALAHHGQGRLLLGQTDEASALLADARTLYAEEHNAVGVAMVSLTEAQLHYAKGDYASAATAAAQAEEPLAAAGAQGRALLARWLHGESSRTLGRYTQASALLEATLRDADQHALPQIAYRCHTSLGLLAAMIGDWSAAEASFERSVALIEEMRAPLPAEEFRTAFLADKLTPYAELVRLCLDDDRAARISEALGYVERARSRALVDMLGGALQPQSKPRDRFEATLLERLQELREELNWFYSQIDRAADSEFANSAAAMEELHNEARTREAAILEIARQLQQLGQGQFIQSEPFDIALLQRELGPDTALVEYFSLDGELLAFLVTEAGVQVVRNLGSEDVVEAALGQLRFQIGALRYGAERLHSYIDQLTLRARYHLQTLYELLLRPIEDRLGAQRLVVVPHRALHYVPFHALYDGARYVVERREISYTPSAAILHHCLAQPRRALERALLLGVPDERTPRVHDEVTALAPLFPDTVALLGEQATLEALHERAPGADVLHLACHGQFRPDNPLFSALRLADGWLTVRDAYNLELRCGLVTLSACETGVGAVVPGDELIGLARGFFSAGAPSLLVSLWTVDDVTTAGLMARFYVCLRAGANPAAALRQAQCELLESHPHPFFWSPFVVLGRW
jgi:CHAT domain-containing protein/tetratricopeptide (TPR) repeat protein